ncbi:MAG: toll/interleukin-1 receptor domain-containing protein [Gammaproteobacteria bacterium]
MSYAWDHSRDWVLALAERLRNDGIDIVLDQWETVPGDMLPKFMESAVRESDYVLVVCTPSYKKKSDDRTGGVGYEGDIMTAEVFALEKRAKFIPLLREGDWRAASPSWLLGAYYLDLRGEQYSSDTYGELLDLLLGRRKKAPDLGTSRPSWAELSPIEIVQIPLSSELPQFSKDGWLTLIAHALAKTFSDQPTTRFVGLLSQRIVERDGNEFTVVSMTAPFSRFLKSYKLSISSLMEASLRRDRPAMEEQKADLADTLSKWRYRVEVGCGESWTANQFVVDAETKLIEVTPATLDTKQKKFWRPKSTSEVLALIAHLSNPIVQMNIDGLLEDPRLTDLVKDLLDHKYVNMDRLHVALSNPEQWEYSGDEDV